MSFFNSNQKQNPTKFFITYLPEVPSTQQMKFSNGPNRSVFAPFLGAQGVVIDMALNAAPKLIEQGTKLLSDTIDNFAEDHTTPTTITRNIDILTNSKLSLPSSLTIIRGDFSPKVNEEGNNFGDFKGKPLKQATLLGEKELHIEIDIKKSKDNKSIYFQPTRYFYGGVDIEGNSIDEIVLCIAFVPVNESVMSVTSLEFQSFIYLKNLEPNQEYEFKSKDGYDPSYQSTWMQPALDPAVPYTLVIEIHEVRKGNSFAKLLKTVYGENKKYISEELNQKVHSLQEAKEK